MSKTSSFPVPRYRRADFWLPHGLAKDTSVDQIAAQLTACEVVEPFNTRGSECKPVPVGKASLVNKGKMRVELPGLQPYKKYRLVVSLHGLACFARSVGHMGMAVATASHRTWLA